MQNSHVDDSPVKCVQIEIAKSKLTGILYNMARQSKPQSVLSKSETPDRLTDRKRASIVEAAVHAFQRFGYHAASINAIADAASVSKRTLYNHFESKEALFEAIIEELVARVEQLPQCEFDAERDLVEQLTELAQSEVDFLTSEDLQALARAGLSRVLTEPEVGQLIDHRHVLKRVTVWMKDAQKAGLLVKADPEFAATQFVGLLRTFAFWPTIAHGETAPTRRKLKQIIAATVEMFLNTYAAEKRAAHS